MKNIQVTIKGGLGNQIFQVAFANFLKKKIKNINVVLNTSWYLFQKKRKFNINKYYLYNFEETNKKITFIDKLLSYRNESLISFFAKKKIIFKKVYDGYWQETFYANFIDKKNFNSILFKKNKKFPKKYYIIHFRADDFKSSKMHHVLQSDYYNKLIKRYLDLPIFALGDKKHANKIINQSIFKNYIKFINLNEFESLRTIIQASGGIASNSTFCWWGIYLNPKKKKFVMPEKWMKNINYTSSKIKLKLVESV
jgi:hypothetical protein